MKQILDGTKKIFSGPKLVIMLLIGAAMTLDNIFASTIGTFSLAMAALAEDRSTEEREGRYRTYKVKGGVKIYAGSMACVDANGLAVPAADTAGLIFVGRAESQIDNTAGSDGDLTITVRRGTFNWGATGLTDANVGDAVFVLDDQTVGISSGSVNKVFAGVISEVVSATSAWVEQDATLVAYAKSGAAVAAIATADADATYGQPEADLVNEIKAQFNALRTSLINAGLLRP